MPQMSMSMRMTKMMIMRELRAHPNGPRPPLARKEVEERVHILPPSLSGYRFPLVRGSPVTVFSSGIPQLDEKLPEVELEVGVPLATS